MPFSKAMCYIAVFSVMPGGSCMGRCGVSACSNHRCRTGMHLAHKWCRQQDPHFCGVSFEISKVKLSCKTARKHYLSTQESHRGACTLCLELGHTVRLKIGTELVLLRDLTFSVHCWFSSWGVSNITHATLLFHGNPHPLLSEYKPKVHIFQGIVWITFLILITFLHFFLRQPSFGY